MTQPTIYWEDVAEGEIREGGTFAFDTAAIKRFALEFDPRPTHLDEAAAAETFFNGLSASGAHTFAAWARLIWELTPGWATQAGTNIREMRLLRPVRPGDVLSLRFTVLAKRPNPLRPGFGFLDSRQELFNQEGRPILVMECTMMMEGRPGGTPEAPSF